MTRTDLIDRPDRMRDEDAIDGDAVTRFLKERIGGLPAAPRIAQFPGGASNLTYLISYPDRDLILRRPPPGAKAKSAHNVLREARIMAGIRPHYPFVSEIVATCDDPAVLGSDFYVMSRLVGIIPRRDLPPGLGLDPAGTRALCCSVLDKLVELHSLDVEAAGLSGLGKGVGYVRRQFEGWAGRWQDALTDGIDPMRDVLEWLGRTMPERETRICLIHNDFRFDNVVLSPENPLRVIGVLDWEMAALGDPLMDLGGALAYWVQADDDPAFQANRRQPTNAPGMLTRQEVLTYYAERTGFDVGNFDFYAIFGLFRLAVIIQQIFRRFVRGQTTNPRFAAYGASVNLLAARCRASIAGSTL